MATLRRQRRKVEEERGEADHRVERGADLVAHPREELGLGLVRFDGVDLRRAGRFRGEPKRIRFLLAFGDVLDADGGLDQTTDADDALEGSLRPDERSVFMPGAEGRGGARPFRGERVVDGRDAPEVAGMDHGAQRDRARLGDGIAEHRFDRGRDADAALVRAHAQDNIARLVGKGLVPGFAGGERRMADFQRSPIHLAARDPSGRHRTKARQYDATERGNRPMAGKAEDSTTPKRGKRGRQHQGVASTQLSGAKEARRECHGSIPDDRPMAARFTFSSP